MTLTKYEKETIILFNEGEDTAHIQTYNVGLRTRLAVAFDTPASSAMSLIVTRLVFLTTRIRNSKPSFYHAGA